MSALPPLHAQLIPHPKREKKVLFIIYGSLKTIQVINRFLKININSQKYHSIEKLFLNLMKIFIK